MGKSEQTLKVSCSFCAKPESEVAKIIAGPSVYICDECIGLCNDIIAYEVEDTLRIHNDLELAADRLRTSASHLHRLREELRKPGVEPQAVALAHARGIGELVLAYAREVTNRTDAIMTALGTPDTHPGPYRH